MKYLIGILIALPLTVFAQVKFDYTWLFGYPSDIGDSTYNGTRMDFSATPPTLTYFGIPFMLDANASICDSSGNLLFYTNGCTIANKNHEMMLNGDEINFGGLRYEQSCLGIFGKGYNYGYPTDQGCLILPWPGKPKRYILLHLHIPEGLVYIQNLKYTTIDMNGDNGLGEVLEKNQQVFQDTFANMLTAVRHANGRDWWIVLPRFNLNLYYVFLLSPDGIGDPKIQALGNPANALGRGVQATFSPNGRMYANMSPEGGLQVFDFDRCQGEFKPFYKTKNFDFSNSFGTSYACGVAFSPSSRFLYVASGHSFYQFDIREENPASTQQLIASYDGFGTESGATSLPTNFYQMMLAPNGKIYMSTPNGTRYFHVIHNPDSLGEACNFEQRGLHLLTPHGFSPPNYPHFRLYDLPGSPCDTLGINGPQPPEDTLPTPPVCAGSLRLWPNPAISSTQIELPGCVSGSVNVFDVAGRWMQDLQVPEGGGMVPLDVSGYPPGVYFLHWSGVSGNGEVRRLVVLR